MHTIGLMLLFVGVYSLLSAVVSLAFYVVFVSDSGKSMVCCQQSVCRTL